MCVRTPSVPHGTNEAEDHHSNFYDARVNLANPEGETFSLAYDAAGQLISTTDGTGATTTLGYDAAGRTVSSTDPLSVRVGSPRSATTPPVS